MTSVDQSDHNAPEPGGEADPLWIRLHAGDKAVLDDLYGQHAAVLRRYFDARLPDKAEAEDCVQEVFLRCAAAAAAVDPPAVKAIAPWLWGIADKVRTDRTRSNLRVREMVHAQPVDTMLSTHVRASVYHERYAADNEGKQQAIADAHEVIATLPENRRHLLNALIKASQRKGDEVKGAELAAELGWDRERVDRELSRGRADVRRGMAILAVARDASRPGGCQTAARLISNPGPRLRFGELSRRERSALASHTTGPAARTGTGGSTGQAAATTQASGCKRCVIIFKDAERSGLYALGPDLFLLARYGEHAEDEQRKAALTLGPRQPAASTSAGTPPTATAAGPLAATASPVVEAGVILAPASDLVVQGLRRPVAFMADRFGQLKAAGYVRLTGLVNFMQANPWTRVVTAGTGVAVTGGIAAAIVLSPGQPPPAAASSAPLPVGTSLAPTAAGGSLSPAPPPDRSNASGPSGAASAPSGGLAPSGAVTPGGSQPTGPSAPSQTGAVTPGGSQPTGPSAPSQASGTQNSSTSTGTGQVTSEWGFALDRWVDDPVGSTHELWATPEEADWTYGPWRFGQPDPIPVARATHLSIGRHLVVLPGVGAPGGIVQVSVYDYTAEGAFCQPVSWGPQGADEAIEVACFDRSGQPADAPFATLFLAGNRGQQSLSGARGFVYDASPTTPSYTPGPLSESNVGTVTRTGTGLYTVALTGGAEAVQVSAVSSQPRHCGVTGLTATTEAVACTTADGTPADTAFTLSYTGRQSLLDDRRVLQAAFIAVSDAPSAAAPSLTDWWLSKPGTPTVARTATGRYTLHMPMGYIPSYTHVTPRGSGYCNVVLRNDYSFKDNATFYIACFTGSGAPADNGFDLTYMTASPYE